MPSRLAYLLALSLSVSTAFAAVPYRVADLRTVSNTPSSSYPAFIGTLHGTALFAAATSQTAGRSEVWRTDGTVAGTTRLLGGDFTYAGSPVSDGQFLYFGGGNTNWNVWKSDGTAAGTVPLFGGFPLTKILPVAVVSGRVLFLPNFETELWVIDSGTSMRLAVLNDLFPESPTPVATWRGNAYIGGETGLWKTDGTRAGTVKLTSASVRVIAATDDALYFIRPGESGIGSALWTSDGTEAGTRMVAPLDAAYTLEKAAMIPLGNKVVIAGAKIGVSDGTAAGTQILRTGYPPSTRPTYAVVNGVAYFPFWDPTYGDELWRSDGTATGTSMVGDLPDGFQEDLHTITAGATRVYYYRRNELFESDGTNAGTHAVDPTHSYGWKGRESGSLSMATIGDTVLFNANDGKNGNEPWVSDGTDAGTQMLANLAPEKSSGSSSPANFVPMGDRFYFAADTDDGKSVFSTDGANVTPLISNEDPSAVPLPVAAIGNTLILRKDFQLWTSNGTAGNETLLKDFSAVMNSPLTMDATAAAGRVYVIGQTKTDALSTSIWATDGTPSGTVDLGRSAASLQRPVQIVTMAGQAYTVNGGILYAIDPVPNGVRSIARLTQGSSAATTPFGGSLYSLSDSLAKFSTSATGVSVLKQLPQSEHFAAAADTSLFFTLREFPHPLELWKTDGTAAGTVLATTFGSSPTSSVKAMTSLGSRIIAALDDGAFQVKPWVTDGTAAGTKLLRDIKLSNSSTTPPSFFVADGIAYFSATDAEHGTELWQTDGTPEGTTLVADIVPGADSSAPTQLARAGDLLYFSATTPNEGRELWAYVLPPAPAITIDDARASEASGHVSVPVRLTRSSTRRVTVHYETVDESAKAGVDYTASSGSIVFEPGEMSKSVSVPLARNATPGTTRAFHVRLKDADAALERVAAAALIEDSDLMTDLTLAFQSSSTTFVVRNAGPSPASNIVFCSAVSPGDTSFLCTRPFELAAGATREQNVQYYPQDIVVAKATQWEPEATPANNVLTSASYGESGTHNVWIIPAVPRAGETGILSVSQFNSGPVTVTSSDPSVIAAPPSFTVPPGNPLTSTSFTALKSGVTTLTLQGVLYARSITVRVIGASEPARNASVTSAFYTPTWYFGSNNELEVRVDGFAPNGAQPTGTVMVSRDGHPLATLPLVNQKAMAVFPGLEPGVANVTLVYSGDANFLDTVKSYSKTVFTGTPSFSATAMDGGPNVTIVVRGLDGYPPTGTMTVKENGATTRSVGGLAKSGPGSSAALATGFSPAARTVAIVYSGDAHYSGLSVTIPIAGIRRHATR